MDTLVINNSLSEQGKRIDWVDVCKGFAIFFIYFGHWITESGNLKAFSYSFHLQLFFIISGFFAIKQQKKKNMQFIKHQIYLLLVPFLFFTIVNIVYFNLNGYKTLNELVLNFSTNFTDFTHSVSPELWFLPSLFCVTVFFFFLLKLIKKPIIVFLISYFLYMIQICYNNTILKVILYPFIEFMGISSIPTYLLWYSLGALLFPYIKKIINIMHDDKSLIKYLTISTGIFLTLMTILIYFFKPDNFWRKLLSLIGSDMSTNNFVYVNFKICITIIICSSFIFLSYVFRNSKIMSYIGKNTLILIGFEFLMKDFLVLNLIPMFNIGIIKLESTVQIIIISSLTLISIMPLFKLLNKHVPFLIGKSKKQL